MDDALTSTFSGALSQRTAATAVDASNFAGAGRPEATTDSTMGEFSKAEMDFETRNWRAARDVFQNRSGHKDKKAMAEFLSQQESPQQAKASCEEASAKAGKQYAPGIGGVLSKIEAFMKVGDVAMKTAPESVGLAWMGVRLCMHSFEDDFATFRIFSGAASSIVGILISCRAYGKMYGGDGGQKGLPEFQELHQKVVDYIPSIYSQILEFSYQMSKHVGRNVGIRFVRGLLSSAAGKFKSMIDGFTGSEKTMTEFAQKAHMQLSEYYAELTIQKQDTGLGNQQAMMANLNVIQDTLQSNAEITNLLADHIKELNEEKKNMKKKTPLDKAKEAFEANAKKLNPTNSSEIAFERNRSKKDEGTCQWIFELEDYKSWRTSSESGIIWVSGVGGMGKSVLMSTMIDRLQSETRKTAECSLQYFICSQGDDATRLAARIKDQLVHQLYALALSQDSSDVLEKANDLVADYAGSSDAKGGSTQKKSAATTFEDVYPALALLLNKKVYLVIDALDECSDRKASRILKTLQSTMFPSEHPDFRLHIAICSRPETDVVEDLAGKPVIKVEDHNGPDIEHAAELKINSLPGFSPAERKLACKAIVQKAKGLFRCVDPAIEFLRKPLQRPLERALERLPSGLDDSYQQIFRQTDPEYLELLKTALHWTILGQREPTIAEIMDDYSCAYEQSEGSDVNPYDDMSNPLLSEEMRRLIPEQIRAAGSSTFLEVIAASKVKVRHSTVTEFFLRSTTTSSQPIDDCADTLCSSCKARASHDQTWSMKQKEGQLRMAITIFKHLNSPLFRKRYLPEESRPVQLAKETIAQVETNGSADASTKKLPPAESATGDSRDKIECSPQIDDSSAHEQARGKAQQQDSDDDGSSDSSDSADTSHNENVEGSAPKTNNEASERTEEVPEPSAGETQPVPSDPAQDSLTDDEDIYLNDDSSESSSDTSGSDDDDEDSDDDVTRSTRYELTYWPHHLQAAEQLWTQEEKSTNNDWKELWGLVIKFLVDTPGAFMTWKRRYAQLPDHYDFDDGDYSWTPLHVAASYGLTGLCEVLIEHGQSATAQTSDGRSILWCAAEHSLELLRLLLDNGASPNVRTDFPSPFQRLLWHNPKAEPVALMLKYQADCKLKDSYEFTAMHWFGLYGEDPEVLGLLLANGGEINATDTYGETALHKLMWQWPLPLPLLNDFIEKGADIHLSDKESQQPLYEVSSQGAEEGARILLDHGADIEHADVNGVTALHVASGWGHLDTVKLLVERKASLTKPDAHSRTAFFAACANNHLEVSRFLLDVAHEQGHHESIRQPMDDGRTPFSKACGRGNLDVVKMLKTHGDANIDVNAIEGIPKRTALHWAAYNNRVDVVLFLLQNGADATIADANGKTPLTLAGLSWSKEKSLIREPMILALIDSDPRTATHDAELMAIAAIRGSIRVIEKLLDAKAPASKQDEHGWTPLQLARQYGNIEAAAVLSRRGAVVGSRPNKWSTDAKAIQITEDGQGLKFIGKDESGEDTHTILANHPIPAGVERFYYEISVDPDVGNDDSIFNAIGFACQPARLDRMPGWYNAIAPSWAYHGDDGNIYANNNSSLREYARPYGKGATVGCGVVFMNGVDGHIFYTRDGVPLGVAFDKGVRGRLYPAVGMSEPAGLRVNWGDDLVGRPFLWEGGNRGGFGVGDVGLMEMGEGSAMRGGTARIGNGFGVGEGGVVG